MVTKKGNKVNKLASVFIFLMLFGISLHSSAWAGYTYTEIIPPTWQWAEAGAINDGGAIVGLGWDANGVKKGFIATLQSVCTTWTDVIAKYNAYVNGQSSWDAVITCYNQYASP